jgi:hypothetical protein
MFRIAAFHHALIDGDLLPGWAGFLSYGWGSPVFLFNWSLPYWLAQPPVFLGASIVDALKIVEGGALVGSFVTMLLFLRSRFRLLPSLVGALAYAWAPFHIYLHYRAGALGMEVALILWPMVLFTIARIEEKKRHAVLWAALAFALLMLTHQVMFLMILPFWLYLALIHAYAHPNPKQFVFQLFISLALGLGLAGYFWLPAIVEKKFINIDTQTGLTYQRDFLPLWILFLQPGFAQAAGDNWFKHIYALGWAHIGAVVLWLTTLRKKIHEAPGVARLTWGAFGFFLLSVFLITPLSSVLWQTIPLLSSFIYPVRFEALSILTASILLAAFLDRFKNPYLLSLLCATVIILINFPAIPLKAERIRWPDTHFYYGDSTSDQGEYLPRWADAAHFFGDNRWERHPPVRAERGAATVSDVVKTSSSVSFTIKTEEPIDLVINQLYFPGWNIRVDGQSVPVTVTPEGEMGFSVQKGAHAVEARFGKTPIRQLGGWISLISLVVGVCLAIGSPWAFLSKPWRG